MLLRGDVGLAALFSRRHCRRSRRVPRGARAGQELVVLPVALKASPGWRRSRPPRRPRARGAARRRRRRASLRRTDDVVAPRLDATFLQPARTRFGADAWDAPPATEPRWASTAPSPTRLTNHRRGCATPPRTRPYPSEQTTDTKPPRRPTRVSTGGAVVPLPLPRPAARKRQARSRRIAPRSSRAALVEVPAQPP